MAVWGTGLYLVCVAAWLLIWVSVGDRFWWSFAANALAPWFFLIGLGPAALVALVAHKPLLQHGVLLTAGVAAWLWGALFLPAWPSTPAPGGEQLRVVSLNTLTHNTDTEALVNALRSVDADVLALQELSSLQAEAVTAALGERYPYQMLQPWDDPRGIGIWSRFPMEPITNFDEGLWENWGQHVVLGVAGRRVHLINVHVWPPSRNPSTTSAWNRLRMGQVGFLTTYLRRIPNTEPFLMAGDLNITPQNDGYFHLSQVARDTWAEVGWGMGFTWPDRFAVPMVPHVFRIDYLWHSPEMWPLEIQLLPDGTGSDHRGVVASFYVLPRAEQ